MPLPPATVLVFLPMTGVSAPCGVAVEHGIRLAEEHHHGRVISFEVIDTRRDVFTAATTTIGEAARLAVLAEVSPTRALRIAEVAQAQRVPLVTPTATLLLRAVDSLPASVYEAWLHDPSAATAAPAREAIRSSLATLRRFRGVTGLMSMGPDRNPRKPVVEARIQDGVPAWAATIDPE